MESISLRINKIVVDLFGGNVSRFAEKVGTNEANVRNYIKGTTPKYDFILSVYQNIEINFEWFLTGKGEMLNESNQNVQPVESLNRAEGDFDYRLIIEEQKNIITALKDQVEFYKTQHTTDNDTIDYIKNRTDDIYEFITTQEALREFDKIFEKAVQLGKDKAKEKGLEDLIQKIESLKK